MIKSPDILQCTFMNTEPAFSVLLFPCVAWMLNVVRAIPLLSTFLKGPSAHVTQPGSRFSSPNQSSGRSSKDQISFFIWLYFLVVLIKVSQLYSIFDLKEPTKYDLDPNFADLTELCSKLTWCNEPIPFVRCCDDHVQFRTVSRSYLVVRMNIAWVLQHSMGFGAASPPGEHKADEDQAIRFPQARVKPVRTR